jgi:hypothetical protein
VASSRSRQVDHSGILETHEAGLQPDLLPPALHVYARAFCSFLEHEIEELAPLSRHAAWGFEVAVKLADAASRATALTEALTHPRKWRHRA